jgi:predicted DNA-binding transcriptional regulator YafY
MVIKHQNQLKKVVKDISLLCMNLRTVLRAFDRVHLKNRTLKSKKILKIKIRGPKLWVPQDAPMHKSYSLVPN